MFGRLLARLRRPGRTSTQDELTSEQRQELAARRQADGVARGNTSGGQTPHSPWHTNLNG